MPVAAVGREHVDANVVFGAFEMQHVHQADHRRLRRAVVGLAEIAVDARGRRGEHDAAVVALAHAVPDRLGADRRAQQMHLTTSSKSAISILAKVLSRKMPALLTRMSTLAPAAFGARATIAATCSALVTSAPSGERGAARALDLLDDFQRRLGRRAARPEIVDDDLRAARGEAERMAAAEPAARAGDDGDAAVKRMLKAFPLLSVPAQSNQRLQTVSTAAPRGDARTGTRRSSRPGPLAQAAARLVGSRRRRSRHHRARR